MNNDKYNIYIFGAGSKIARKAIGNLNNYNILGFAKKTKIRSITEYKTIRIKSYEECGKYINKINSSRNILIFMETLSISNLIVNKSKKEIKDEIDVNLINPHIVIKSVLPLLIKNRWGRIIFAGSSRALKSDTGISGYTLSKFASLGYSKSLSKEYGRFGITSNYLSLGLFESPLLEKLKKTDYEKILKNTDTKSIGDYESISNALEFIINSKYVTGSKINIDGGFD